MNASGLYVDLPNREMRWVVRRAALEHRCTIRQLVVEILSGWLAEHGYLDTDPDSQGVESRCQRAAPPMRNG
jgi:hypothetical protein